MITTFSTSFKNKSELEKFIEEKKELLSSEVLCQIFFKGHNLVEFREIAKTIKTLLPKTKVAGLTVKNVVYKGKAEEGKTVIVFNVFEKSKVDIALGSYIEDENEYEVSRDVAKKIVKPNTKVCLLFATTPYINGEAIIKGIESVNKDIIIIGGNAYVADTLDYKETAICVNETIKKGTSFCLVALSGEELIAHNKYMFNWLNVGSEHEITKTDGNKILEIERTPAKHYYEKLVGEGLKINDNLGSIYPLVMERDGIEYSYPVFALDDSMALGTYENIKEGTKVKLAYGNRYNILKQAENEIKALAKLPVETAFYYSCISRYELFKGEKNFDFSVICNNLDINGFYAAGEFSYTRGRNVYVKNSASVLALAESDNSRIEINENNASIEDGLNTKEEFVLHRFLKKSVEELESLNETLEGKVKEKTEEINMKAHHYRTTGLLNNLSLIERIEKGLIDKVALIKFKFIWEFERFYGHEFSSKIQKYITKILEEKTRDSKLKLFQIRSNIFAIASNEGINENDFVKEIKDIQKTLFNSNFDIDGVVSRCYNKIGVTIKSDFLREKAFLALDQAEDNGQALVVYADDLRIFERNKENLNLIDTIQAAIDEKRIVPYYQPIYDNNAQEVYGFECLVRMIRRDGSIVPPFVFLEAAKKSGLYSELTIIMVKTVFEKFKNINKSFSINIDVIDMFNAETMNFIYKQIENFPDKKRIIFEILESGDIEASDIYLKVIKRLKDYGVRIAIDDFGSGYSNIKYLVMLDVDILKIDGAIVRNVHNSEHDRKLVLFIRGMAKASNAKVVAEYIENKEIQDIIKKARIEYSQGYYINKPLPDVQLKCKLD